MKNKISKYMLVGVSLFLLPFYSGCGSKDGTDAHNIDNVVNAPNKEDEGTAVQIDSPSSSAEKTQSIDGFEPASHEKYNLQIDNNGLIGNHIYVDGYFNDIKSLDGYDHIILSAEDGEWLIGVGVTGKSDAYKDTLEKMYGHKVRVFGEYFGFSDVFQRPAISIFGEINDGIEENYRIEDLVDKNNIYDISEHEETGNEWKDAEYSERTIGDVTYLEPVGWESSPQEGDAGMYYYPHTNGDFGMVYVGVTDPIPGPPRYEATVNGLMKGAKDSELLISESVVIDGYDAHYVRYTGIVADQPMEIIGYLLSTNTNFYTFMFGEIQPISQNMLDYAEFFIENVKIEPADTGNDQGSLSYQTPSATPTPKPTEISIQSDNSNRITTGEQNALSSAKAYLRVSAFSYDGLIGQLKYEGYSESEAKYAVDNCGTDWNEQALKSAKNYLGVSSFSYTGLIKQLEYEKYTSNQARYAADNCRADWNKEAVESAANYLNVSSFSRDQLIKQLEYEGFTHEQAVYGVSQNGY